MCKKKTFTAGVHKFSKKLRANTKFLVLKAWMKQVPYWGHNNSKHHCTKFGHHGDLAPGICAFLC